MFVYSLLWAMGGCLSVEGRDIFEKFLSGFVETKTPPNNYFNYYYDREIRNWRSWDERVKAKGFEIP